MRSAITAQKNDPQVAVTKEPTIRLPSGENLKPDLVIKSQERVFVVDVTIRHEDGDNLTQGHTDKVRKYTPLLPVLRQRIGANDGEVNSGRNEGGDAQGDGRGSNKT